MSKAGSKIIKGLKEARAVVRGEKLPARVTTVGLETDADAHSMMALVVNLFDKAMREGRSPIITITFPKKEKRAHGRKS